MKTLKELRTYIMKNYDTLELKYVPKGPQYASSFDDCSCLFYDPKINLITWVDDMDPADYEQDIILISLNKDSLTMEEIDEYLIRITFWLDCTDCCDAIEFIKEGQYHILIKIQSHKTYHS